MNSAAGIIGVIFAAFFTGFLDPYWCFAFYAITGAIVAVLSLRLNKELEEGEIAKFEIIISKMQAEAQANSDYV